MNCSYPLCRQPALWKPVIAIPTVRSIGLIKPELSPLINQTAIFDRNLLDRNMTIRQYEASMDDYKQHESDMVTTSRPTILIGRPICERHKASYKLSDWISEADWSHLQEMARHYGFDLEASVIITVLFKPLGWKPQRRLEVGH
jgi:hypothetical protein